MNKEIDKEVMTKSLKDFSSEEARLLNALAYFGPTSPRDIEEAWPFYSGMSSSSVRILVQKLVTSGDLIIDDHLKLVLREGICIDSGTLIL